MVSNMETASTLQTLFSQVHTIRYAELASSAIIVYDHLITLDQEYNLIWSSSWSIGKCLFLINRYYTLLTVIFNNYALFSQNVTNSVSLSWYRWQGWTGVISFIIAELILQLRLYALYLLDKRVLVLMAMSSLLAASASAGVMGDVLSKIRATAHPFGQFSFCVAEDLSDHFYAYWIPMLVSESVLCGLALLRFVQTHRRSSTLFQTGKHLVTSLIRDSVFYFVVMFATYLANTIVFIVGTTTEVEIPIGFSVALSCVLGNRLCLNVRGMIRGDDELFTTVSETKTTATPQWIVDDESESVYNVEGGTQLTYIQLSRLRSLRSEVALHTV